MSPLLIPCFLVEAEFQSLVNPLTVVLSNPLTTATNNFMALSMSLRLRIPV